MSVPNFTTSKVEALFDGSKSLSCPPELIVESSATLGLKSKQSLNSKDEPVVSEL